MSRTPSASSRGNSSPLQAFLDHGPQRVAKPTHRHHQQKSKPKAVGTADILPQQETAPSLRIIQEDRGDTWASILVHINTPVLGPSGKELLSHFPINGQVEWSRISQVVVGTKDPRSGRGVPIRMVRQRPATLSGLREQLHIGRLHAPYAMVQISGHASPEGLLAMEQRNGREDQVTPSELAEVFQKAGVRIVFLNICHGLPFAEELHRHGVPVVLTAAGEIRETEAILVAEELYRLLIRGETVGSALDWARRMLQDAYCRGVILPPRHLNVDDPERFAVGRVANLRLVGDPGVRLPLPPPGGAARKAVVLQIEPPHNLPCPDELFFGRGSEIVEVSDWLEDEDCAVIALTGIAGYGKSTLVLRIAQRNRWRFRRAFYLSARDLEDRPQSLTVDDIARTVESVLRTGSVLSSIKCRQERIEQLAQILNSQPSLLVLDNLEVLSGEEQKDLAKLLTLLDPRMGTKVLMTLRPGDFPPLLDPCRRNVRTREVRELDAFSGIVLLARLLRLHLERPPTEEEREVWDKVKDGSLEGDANGALLAFTHAAGVPAEKVAALDQLAYACHHHPLLMRYAIAELKIPGSLWNDVLRGMHALRSKNIQVNVETKIGEMCDYLAQRSPRALRLLQAMLLFTNGATREALRFVVCGREVGEDSEEAIRFDAARHAAVLAALLDFKDHRYHLHPLVRQYLQRRRRAMAERQRRWERAFATYFRGYAEQYRDHYDLLAEEQQNLFAALDWAQREREDRFTVDFGLHLYDFLWVRGFWTEGRTRMLQGIRAAQRLGATPHEAYLLHHLGTLCRYQGDPAQARHYLRSSLELAEACDDQFLMATALLELGVLLRYEGKSSEARSHYQKALKLERRFEDRLLRAQVFHELSVLAGLQGRFAEARRYGLAALALAEELNNPALKAGTLHQMSMHFWAQGHCDEARDYCEQALQLAETLNNQLLKARILQAYGVVVSTQGDLSAARRYFRDALRLREQLGDKVGQAATRYFLGELEFLEGNVEAAAECLQRGLALSEELSNPYWRGWNLYGLGKCAAARGQREKARTAFDQAMLVAVNFDIIQLADKAGEELERLQNPHA